MPEQQRPNGNGNGKGIVNGKGSNGIPRINVAFDIRTDHYERVVSTHGEYESLEDLVTSLNTVLIKLGTGHEVIIQRRNGGNGQPSEEEEINAEKVAATSPLPQMEPI